MKKQFIKITALVAVLFAVNPTFAQSNTSSGGGKLENGDVKVTVTIGEPTIGVIGDSSNVEVGFQQVYEAKEVSVEETISKLELNVYPNPTANEVTIQNANEMALEYQVYDLAGKVILKGSTSSALFKFDLSDKSAGIYIVKFINTKNQQAKSFKITKK